MLLLVVALATFFLGVLGVRPSKLKQAQVGLLVVGVSRDGFQALEHQTLAHGAEVCAQGVEHVHARLGLKVSVGHEFRVRGFRERVGHDFGEAQSDQELSPPKQHVLAVGLGGHFQRSRHALGQRDVVEAVNAKHLFCNVCRTCHVASVRRHVQSPLAVSSLHDVDVQSGQDGSQPVVVDGGAQEPKEPFQGQGDFGVFHPGVAKVLGRSLHFSTGPFLQQVDAPFRSHAHRSWIHPAFEAEAGVRAQGVPFGGFPDGDRMEPGRLEEDLGRSFADPTLRAAVHPGQTHGDAFVGDDQVFRIELTRLVVQGGERFALTGLANGDGLASNLVQIEGVKGVAKFVEHEVGGVDHVVDGLNANGAQLLLGPIGARPHLNAVQFNGEVVRAIFRGLHVEGNRRSLCQGIVQWR